MNTTSESISMQTSRIQNLPKISKPKSITETLFSLVPITESPKVSSALSLLLLQPQNSNKPLDPKSLHGLAITSGLIANPFAASRIIQLLLNRNHNCSLQYASLIFDSLTNPDVYTWNLMISSAHKQCASTAYYFRMRASRAPPNAYTYALLVKSCGNGIRMGRMAHGQVLKCGVQDWIVIKNSVLRMYCNLGLLEDAQVLLESNSACVDLISWNTMINAYGKNGDVEIARRMFDRMPDRNLVSWSVVIDGYVRKGDFSEALRLFHRLRDDEVEPDEVILVSVLKACANLGALDEGRWIHQRYVDHSGQGRDGNVVLETALVDMYCKCGCAYEAVEVFDRVKDRDVVLWNAMIGGLAMHGESQHALQLFKKMVLVPNGSTYISVLRACTHSGLVDEGIEIFESMKKHRVEPRREHFGCLADLLGRAGRVREAEELLLTMPVEAEAGQWGALMSACITHKDVQVGERVGRRLIEMEPLDGGRYILLANLYANANEWDKAEDIRREMESKGAKKEIGHSFIE